jgi:hypothetical protein
MNPGFPFPAIIAIKIRKITGRFKEHGAVTPDSALPLETIGVSKHFLLSRLIRRGVIMEGSQDKYYLNEENLALFNRNRRTKAVIVLTLMIIAISIYLLLHMNH